MTRTPKNRNPDCRQLTVLASWICVFALSASVATAATETSRLLDQAEYLMLNCHLSPAYLDSAEGLIDQVRSQNPDNQRSLYLAARLKVGQADLAPGRSGRRDLLRAAQAIAESLENLDDSDARGHVWYGIATGRLGQINGIMNSLAMLPTVKREFNRALALDSTCPEAYEALGRLNFEIPAIAGGNLLRSVDYFKTGLRFVPNYTVLRLDLARALVRLNRKADAMAELDTMLATPEPYPPCDFVLYDKPDAEKLLAQLRAEE